MCPPWNTCPGVKISSIEDTLLLKGEQLPDVLDRARVKVGKVIVGIGREEPFAFHRVVIVVQPVIRPIAHVKEFPSGDPSRVLGILDTVPIIMTATSLATDDDLWQGRSLFEATHDGDLTLTRSGIIRYWKSVSPEIELNCAYMRANFLGTD